MNPQIIPIPNETKKRSVRQSFAIWRWAILIAVLLGLSVDKVNAAHLTLYTNGFDSYAVTPATSLTDTKVTFLPTSASNIRVEDGVAQADAIGGLGWDGVQLINWALASAYNSGNCMLLRPNTAFRCTFDPRGGTNFVWEFSMLSHRFIGAGGANRSYRISLTDEGADQNAHDFLIFRGNQNVLTTGNDRIEVFDGSPGKTWTIVTNIDGSGEVPVQTDVWHHYKFVADAISRKFDLYVDGVLTTTNYFLSRPQTLSVCEMRFANEANGTGITGGGPGAGDYQMIDNVSLQVDGNFIDLANGAFTENFEGYTASTTPAEVADVNLDKDPGGPWLTAETAGAENGKAFLTNSVQVVNNAISGSVCPGDPSGTQCLMVSQQQTSGSTISWAPATNDDVRITWWAKVPPQAGGAVDQIWLRVSLYAWEADYSAASDTILIAYGHRQTGANYGAGNSILTFSRWFSEWFSNGQWGDTFKTYTPNTWEQYQLTTDVKRNSYTLVKFPGSVYGPEETIIKDGQYISSWGNNMKFHTLAFSTSNGGSTASPSPAAYVDKVTVEPFTNTNGPAPLTYAIDGTSAAGARFTNCTILTLPGRSIGGVAVSPLDTNTIVFTVDEEVNGSIMKATKVAGGNWVIDPTPLVSNLYNPSGLTIDTNGTLWYVRDAVKGGQACGLSRLAWPWTGGNAAVQEVVTDFGSSPTNRWDQPCDLAFYDDNGVRKLAVLDRGVDASNNPNAIWTVDPTTGALNQFDYNQGGLNQLVAPDTTVFGAGLGGNANGIVWLPGTGELATIWEGDGVNANGVIAVFPIAGGSPRYIFTSDSGIKFGVGIDRDPTTGRIWAADNVRQSAELSEYAVPQIVSFDANDSSDTGTSYKQEYSFPIITPTAGRPDQCIRMTDPGLRFSQDGKFLVVADKSLHSGGGRLIILHNEPFVIPTINITAATKSGSNFNLSWSSGGAVFYQVQQSASLNPASWVNVSPVLTSPQFTHTGANAGTGFYRVVATSQCP